MKEGRARRTISKREAVVLALYKKAISGDLSAIRAILGSALDPWRKKQHEEEARVEAERKRQAVSANI